jgi:hypothetical protein
LLTSNSERLLLPTENWGVNHARSVQHIIRSEFPLLPAAFLGPVSPIEFSSEAANRQPQEIDENDRSSGRIFFSFTQALNWQFLIFWLTYLSAIFALGYVTL